jgi:signal transduction histidine kinase
MKIYNLKRAVLLPTSPLLPRTSIQPFFTAKPTGEGTGLELRLSYDIVKAQSGEIKVTSLETEGTEFINYLPVNQ